MTTAVGLLPYKCPACGAAVLAAAVQHPIVVRLLVEQTSTERVVEHDDGNLAILPTFDLHAPSCPNWPDDQRDWHNNLAPHPHAEPDDQ